MTAPVPYAAFNKRTALSIYARQVVAAYTQFFRQITDAVAHPDSVNIKNVRQAHSQAVTLSKALTEPFNGPPPNAYLRAIRAAFEAEGVIWPDLQTMASDLTSVNDAATAFSNYVKANTTPDYASFAITDTGEPAEVVKTILKVDAAALVTEINTARAVFGSDPKG